MHLCPRLGRASCMLSMPRAWGSIMYDIYAQGLGEHHAFLNGLGEASCMLSMSRVWGSIMHAIYHLCPSLRLWLLHCGGTLESETHMSKATLRLVGAPVHSVVWGDLPHMESCLWGRLNLPGWLYWSGMNVDSHNITLQDFWSVPRFEFPDSSVNRVFTFSFRCSFRLEWMSRHGHTLSSLSPLCPGFRTVSWSHSSSFPSSMGELVSFSAISRLRIDESRGLIESKGID